MQNDLSRRAALFTGSAAIESAVLAGPAAALTDSQARSLVKRVVSEINSVIDSGKPMRQMIAEFEQIFRRYADISLIARSTLGPASRQTNDAQMRAYTDAFRSYIARKYGKRFHEFIGGRVEVESARKVKSWYEVTSVVHMRGEAPFEVRFLVSDRSGRNLFFDMIVEGISLRLTERTEIGAMLDRNLGNIDKVIKDLQRSG